MIYDVELGITAEPTIVDHNDITRRKKITADTRHIDLLVPVFRGGASVYEPLPLPQIREHAQAQQRQLHPAIKRFVNPHEYPVGLEEQLHDLKTALILAARGFKP